MRNIVFVLSVFFLASCTKEKAEDKLDENSLAYYLAENGALPKANLIACAGGKENGLDGMGEFSTSIFFYPIVGAYDYRYFEADLIADSLNFDKYVQIDLLEKPVFNGYLRKFERPSFTGEKMALVTYLCNGQLHVSDPIRLKTNKKPTEVNPTLVTVTENNTMPTFNWSDGLIDENVIYFQVISDTLGNLISGTYTYDTTFTFYDLNNVVLNVSPVSPSPSLNTNSTYNFLLMAVSEDNWVNLISEKPFQTN